MRCPVAYGASEIHTWPNWEEYGQGLWRPSRPLGFSGLRYLGMRVRLAWSVFIGRKDVLYWDYPIPRPGYPIPEGSKFESIPCPMCGENKRVRVGVGEGWPPPPENIDRPV